MNKLITRASTVNWDKYCDIGTRSRWSMSQLGGIAIETKGAKLGVAWGVVCPIGS